MTTVVHRWSSYEVYGARRFGLQIRSPGTALRQGAAVAQVEPRVWSRARSGAPLIGGAIRETERTGYDWFVLRERAGQPADGREAGCCRAQLW